MFDTYCFQILDVASIDVSDDPFKLIRSEIIEEALIDSIKNFGILHPLLIQRDSEKYFCLSGFNRLRAAQALGIDAVPCRIITEEEPLERRIQLLYLYKQVDGKTTIIEDGCLLRYAQTRLSSGELMELAGLMGYKQSKHALDRILHLFGLEPQVVIAIHEGTVNEKTGRKLLGVSPDEQQLLLELISRFKYGGSKQQKLVETALELSRRKGCPFSSIYTAWQKEVWVTDQKNTPQQGAMLLDFLQGLHEPRSRQAEEKFQQDVQQLNLPPEMEVTHSPAFEKDEVTLRITFPNQSALKNIVNQLKETVQTLFK